MRHDPGGEHGPAPGGPRRLAAKRSESSTRVTAAGCWRSSACGWAAISAPRVESRDILQATLLKSFQRLVAVRRRRRRHADGLADRASPRTKSATRRTTSIASAATSRLPSPSTTAASTLAADVRSALTAAVLSEEAERLGAALESLDAGPPRGHRPAQAGGAELQGRGGAHGPQRGRVPHAAGEGDGRPDARAEGHVMSDGAEALFARWVEHHVHPRRGTRPRGALRGHSPACCRRLQALIARLSRRLRRRSTACRARTAARPRRSRPRRSRTSRGSGPSSASAPAAWGRSTSSTT